jgi:phage I-like protein
MKQQRDSKKRIAFPIQLFSEQDSAVATPREIHIVPTGEWEHWSGYEFEITPQTIAEIVANFKAGVRRDLPITAGHDDGMSGETPAVGWFTDLIDRGVNGLYGVVEWNDEGLRFLSGKMFKYFSAEIDFDLHDDETDQDYGVVLTGGALTNKPFFKQLDLDPSFGFSDEDRKSAASVLMFSVPSIMKQFNTQSMDLNEILAKKPEDLSDEEKAFVVEHKDELNDEQKTAFESVLPATGDEGGSDEGTGAGADEGNDNGDSGADSNVNASEKGKKGKGGKMVTLSEAEVTALRSKADAGQRAFEKLELSERKAMIEKITLSESNKDGRFLPKQGGALEGFVKTLSEKQRDQFVNLINNMPKAQLFGKIGDGGSTGNDVAKEVETAVQSAIKASEGKLSYSAAVKKVLRENPSLEKRYNESLGENE